jgi:hypothetical protein
VDLLSYDKFEYEFGTHHGICGTSTTKTGIGHLTNTTSSSKCKFRPPHPETKNMEK